jgi:hypothetical protein
MTTRRPRWRAGAVACLTAVVVTSCGGRSASTIAASASPPTVLSTPASSGDGPALPEADKKACLGVQAIIAHIAAETARWSPDRHPFDPTIATRLATRTQYLNSQALAADDRVRRAVAATASAFGGVADAIMAKDRAHLDRAVAQSRVAYSSLKEVCAISP